MEISLTTPAVIFPAITLLLLAYSNRFSALSKLIRHFSQEEQKHPNAVIEAQMRNFHMRLHLIQFMEFFGILALLCSVVSIILLYFECVFLGIGVFLLAIISVLISLIFALSEVIISTKALHIQLRAKVGDRIKMKGFFARFYDSK